MNDFRSHATLSMIFASALALTACSQSPPPPPAPKPAPAAPAPSPPPAAPVSAPATAVQVTSVVLGNSVDADGKIAAGATAFAPKDAIHATVSTTTSTANTTIVARWSYQGGQVVKEETQTLAAAGANTTSLTISKPDGWPAGNYTLDILLDGKSISSTPFSVK